jgi:DNA-damage-inducible protein D
MLEKGLDNYNESAFDSIEHIDEFGDEYWETRELQITFGYNRWENFAKVIEKAIISLKTEGGQKEDWLRGPRSQ